MLTEEQFAELAAREERAEVIRAQLLKDNPSLGFINSVVMSQDMLQAEIATQMVRDGASPIDALDWVGSFARFQWAVDNLKTRSLFKRLPELWVSSDPDDTNPEYLTLWRRAFTRNFGTVLDDKRKTLPTGRLTVYRGQVKSAPRGIAWTLDSKIARKFARTGGGRSLVKGGIILMAEIESYAVLAYLTKRGESEVICDPADLENIRKSGIRL